MYDTSALVEWLLLGYVPINAATRTLLYYMQPLLSTTRETTNKRKF